MVASAEMAFNTAAAIGMFGRAGRAAAVPIGPFGLDGHSANTRYVIGDQRRMGDGKSLFEHKRRMACRRENLQKRCCLMI